MLSLWSAFSNLQRAYSRCNFGSKQRFHGLIITHYLRATSLSLLILFAAVRP